MRRLHQIMFPHLAQAKWVSVNLNEEAKGIVTAQHNVLLNINVQSNFVKTVTEANGGEYSYGGYLEDRSTLWRGHYHKLDQMIHLGIDYNVPEGTAVNMPWGGTAVFSTHDKDQDGGWGGMVVFKAKDFYFILAHLDPAIVPYTPGVYLGCGVTAGFVGSPKVNGGWYPHLHLQVISIEEYAKFKNPMDIDGYGAETEDLKERYPNPETIDTGGYD